MFGIGETELVLILLFAFLIFGPDKLPGMGKTIGRALRQFRNAQEGFTEVVQSEVMDPIHDAMGDDADDSTRRRREARSAAMAEDSDREDGEGTAKERTTETFAERKKRLEAEHAAQAAQDAEASNQKGVPAAADADSDLDSDADAADVPGAPSRTQEPADSDSDSDADAVDSADADSDADAVNDVASSAAAPVAKKTEVSKPKLDTSAAALYGLEGKSGKHDGEEA